MTEIDFQAARKNMIDCQLMTNGVHDEDILSVFESVPREQYLPIDKRHLAYIDEDVVIDGNCVLMDPMVFARMVTVAELSEEDTVLNICDVTGYSSAVLSHLVSTVVTVDATGSLENNAQDIWTSYEHCNIACLPGSYQKGLGEHAPYDIIFVNGAMCDVPQNLLDQLSFGGRLITVCKEKPNEMGRILVVQRQNDDSYTRTEHYDAATPFVPCFAPKDEFVF